VTDEEFLAHFEAHRLHEFTHRDHLRVAFAYARRGGISGAVEGARRIRGLAEAHGDFDKYHETLTVGWARVVGHYALVCDELRFDDFVEANPQLLKRDLLSAHYSRELLFSPAARASFVEPDLAPLP
jgi:hypothetical protein